MKKNIAKQYRFTLTMWDVKLVIAIGMLENVQFYLNYVGCKVSSSIYKPPRSKGFTLTMWDVKSTKRVVALFKFSFYLNYVGCKGILISPASFGSAQRFYLNYVGCKVIYYSGRIISKDSFTLTMWDVKLFSLITLNILFYRVLP